MKGQRKKQDGRMHWVGEHSSWRPVKQPAFGGGLPLKMPGIWRELWKSWRTVAD